MDTASSDAVQIVAKTLRVTFTAELRESACKDDPDFSASIDVYQHNNHRPKITLKAIHRTIPEATNLDEEVYKFYDIVKGLIYLFISRFLSLFNGQHFTEK